MTRVAGIAPGLILLTALAAVCPTADADTGPTEAGEGTVSVFILDDAKLGSLTEESAPSSPARLETVLSERGIRVRRIGVEDMANTLTLNRANCDVLILPYGPYFPSAGSAGFQAFVRSGGKFIVTGGYAFATQVGPDYAPDPNAEPLSSREGEVGDHLKLGPQQFPIFDWSYGLRYVAGARPAEDQFIFGEGAAFEGALEGWAACGIIADNKARWMPLVNAYDRHGQLRGAVGAVMRVYPDNRPAPLFQRQHAHPAEGYEMYERTSDALNDLLQCYSGASFAYFGVTNRDLFDGSLPGMDEGLARLVRTLARDVYLKPLQTDFTSYHPGETVKLQAAVANGGKGPAKGTVIFEIAGTDFRQEVPYEAAAGAVARLEVSWAPESFSEDYYECSATLKDEQGRVFDRVRQAFTVWNPEYIRTAEPLDYEDNYFRFGGKPMMVFGTDMSCRTFLGVDYENPLHWRRDAEKRRDYGIALYEILQQAGRKEDPINLRRIESIIQLSRKYDQIYMMGLLIGANCAATRGEMEYQADWIRRVAERYHFVPNLIYYLNGDLRVILTEELRPQLNEFLSERYGGDIELLRKAWGQHAPEEDFPNIPVDVGYPVTGDGTWRDAKGADYNLFRTWMIRRWTQNLIDVIREVDPDSLIVCEFYAWPSESVDIPLAMGNLDISNCGFFESYDQFPKYLAYSDQRFRGKSFGVGEFGRRIHPALLQADAHYHRAVDKPTQLSHYLNVWHYAYGMGMNHIHNWCWNDDDWVYFPWGLNYPSDYVPRDLLYWNRNCSLFFRQSEPVWQAPEVALLTCDNNRLSPGKFYGPHFAVLKAFDILYAAQPRAICTLNEVDLSIPDGVKLIYYPLPYLPSDETLAKLKGFVEDGGTLYISGDISYDELTRQRVHPERLEQLCGVRFVGENYPDLTISGDAVPYFSATGEKRLGHPGIRVEPLEGTSTIYATEDGSPVVTRYELGRGQVVFSTDPLEFHDAMGLADNAAFYRAIMALADVRPMNVTPYDPRIHAMTLPLADGGAFYVFVNLSDGDRTITLNEGPVPVTLDVRSQRPAAVWFDGKGRLRGVEAQGAVLRDGQPILHNGVDAIVFSADGLSLEKSRELVCLPIQAGALRIRSAEWGGPVRAVVGEVRHSEWQAYETLTPVVEDGEVRVELDDLQALRMVLLASPDAMGGLEQKVARMMTQPSFRLEDGQ